MSDKNFNPSKKSLLAQWKAKRNIKKTISGIEKIPQGIPIPLSFGQQQLWFLQQLNPQNPFYNYIEVYEFEGILEVEKLIESIKWIAKQQDILRTTFLVKENQPFQFIHEEPKIDFVTIDLQHFSTQSQSDKVKQVSLEKGREVFDLENGPLTKVTFLRLSKKKNIVIIGMHHIICDKGSLKIFRDELAQLYLSFLHNQIPRLEPLPIQYADFSYWKTSKPLSDSSLNYWKKQLSGDLPILNLPLDKTRPIVPSYNGNHKQLVFPIDLSEKIFALAKESNVTIFHLLLAAYNILLYKYTDEEDLIVGTPISNRDQTVLENVMGYFNDTIVLRSDLSGNPTFLELLGKVRKTSLDAFANKNISFDVLVKTLQPKRSLNINPIFQTMFVFHQVPELPSFGENLKMKHKALDIGVSKFDLTFYASKDKNQLTTIFEYATDLFYESTIQRMLFNFQALIEDIIQDPNARINDLSVTSNKEHQLIISDWNKTDVATSDAPNIHSLIEKYAIQKPNDIAVVFNDQKLTYKELNDRANSVAHYLRNKGLKQQNIVGLCVSRSLEMIIGILGILKAGGAYLPLDLEYPTGRIDFMIKNAGVSFLLTESDLKSNFSNLGIKIISLDEVPSTIVDRDDIFVNSQDPAYVIYTSGSTGQPKGVVINHGNLIHSTTAREQFYPQSPEVFLLMSSYSFDSSIVGIFWTLCYGGTLVIPPRRIEQDMDKLAEIISKNKVTHTLLLPTLYSLLLEYVSTHKLETLKTVIVAGESCGNKVIRQHFNTLPNATLYNEYGPTEATVWCIAHCITKEDIEHKIPIGRPIPNTQVYILNKDFQVVPIGVVGELYIGGKGISSGYIGREDLNLERFVLNPFDNNGSKLYKTGDLASYRTDGIIDFHGRKDYQIKIRGHRIELNEIKKVILDNPNIRDVIIKVEKGHPPTNKIEDDIGQLVETLQSLDDKDILQLLSSIEKLSS